ncbi:MAG TPA: TIGR03560 family F420-dependent LLM class oxidoreductase [Candidatus Limnocylindrales bacterium]|nr:TIGR03560 family F420-dependent LLM class oxidoreductase [Candidatus Limnocylindrales bacterium]
MASTASPTFFLFLPQAGLTWEALRSRARLVEELNYDGLWLVDHFWAGGMPDLDFLEAWTALAALAEATQRIRIGQMVTCNSYRNPALVAKMAATVDNISGGRLELGMGAGWMEEEYRAYGYDFPSMRTRLAQLEEGLELMTRMFEQPRATFHGSYYRVDDAPNQPKPQQSPLPITIGGAGEKILLRLVARYAKRWNCPMTNAPEIERLREVLASHCTAIGRDVSEIIVSEQTMVVVGADEEAFQQKMGMAKAVLGGFADVEKVSVQGTPDRVIAGLREKVSRGVQDFAIMFGDLASEETLELFATKVIPAFR